MFTEEELRLNRALINDGEFPSAAEQLAIKDRILAGTATTGDLSVALGMSYFNLAEVIQRMESFSRGLVKLLDLYQMQHPESANITETDLDKWRQSSVQQNSNASLPSLAAKRANKDSN